MKSNFVIKVNDLTLCDSFYRDVLQVGVCMMSSSFGSYYRLSPDTGLHLLKTNARFLEHGSAAVCWSFSTPDMAALEQRLNRAGFPLFIELSQLPFYDRCSDIDDLILNTVGIFIGALIYFGVKRARRN